MAVPNPRDLLVHSLGSTSHRRVRPPEVGQGSQGDRLPRTDRQLIAMIELDGLTFSHMTGSG